MHNYLQLAVRRSKTRNYIRALLWGLFGATIFPALVFTAGYLVFLMACVVASVCVIGFPIAAIFFPNKLLDAIKPTANDFEIAEKIDERLSC